MDKNDQSSLKNEGWLSIGEAAKYLRVSKDTLRRWEKKGIIKAHRSPTNRRYYKKEDLALIFSKKPDLKEKPLEKTISLSQPPKKEGRLSLVIVSLLTIYIVLMIFLAWLLLRTG